MQKFVVSMVLAVLLSCALVSCRGEQFDLSVKVRMDGKPVAQARVMVDNEEQGLTDGHGVFSGTLRKTPGAAMEVVVLKELPGYRIKPWKTILVIKKPAAGTGSYVLEADLQALRYVMIAVSDKDGPVRGAVVKARGIEAGTTDAQGLFSYEYRDQPEAGLDLEVTCEGHATWRTTIHVEPGQRIEAMLAKQVTVAVSALREEYGQAIGIPGVSVSMNNKRVGATDGEGVLRLAFDGGRSGIVPIALSAPGYIPETWTTSVVLEGDVAVQRYFTPTAPKPIRTGIYGFAGNTPSAELKDILPKIQSAAAARLFANTCFREVPSGTLQDDMKLAKLTAETIAARGWTGLQFMKTVDLIVLGSVARDENGYLIETRFITAGGKLTLSRITRIKNAGDIDTAARDIANAVLARFPFEGTVVAVDGERVRLNLGAAEYRIAKGTLFTALAPRLDETGKVSGLRETVRLRVVKSETNGSWSEVVDSGKDERIAVGDRVVRSRFREGEEEGAYTYFSLLARGGPLPDASPLAGVNIYVNDEWIGATGPAGTAEVPVPLDKEITLVLYRHGYRHITQKLKIDKNRDAREFTLQVNSSLFRIDSRPSSAEVFVDGVKIGRTPILDGKPVNLGLHTVRVSLGGDYRDWEEEVEFSRSEENFTNAAAVALYKDYLKIGEQAEQKGNLDAAIQAYSGAGKEHPDFPRARRRLARIYLDDKGDYDGAIREFERFLSVTEASAFASRRFPADFIHLGRAYYEKGRTLMQADHEAAMMSFGKAIHNLNAAKEQMRFFPNDQYDEAVHDTYYYTALSYHQLFRIIGRKKDLASANLAWKEYFEFFPRKLEGNIAYEQARESARAHWDQLKNR